MSKFAQEQKFGEGRAFANNAKHAKQLARKSEPGES